MFKQLFKKFKHVFKQLTQVIKQFEQLFKQKNKYSMVFNKQLHGLKTSSF